MKINYFLVMLLTIYVHFFDHVGDVLLGRILTQIPHYSRDLFCRDGPIPISVEQPERLTPF